MFLIDDEQTQIVKGNVFGEQPVGADQDIYGAFFEILDNFRLLLFAFKAADGGDVDRVFRETGLEGFFVLLGQYRRRREHGHLFAGHHGFKSRAHGHFGFAVTDVAAKQTVHRLGPFHIAFDLGDASELILRFDMGKIILKFPLPFGVGAEGITSGFAALRVELDQILGDLRRRRFGLGFGFLPVAAVEVVDFRFAVSPGADIGRDGVHLFDGDIKPVIPGIIDHHHIPGFPGDPKL